MNLVPSREFSLENLNKVPSGNIIRNEDIVAGNTTKK